MDLLWFVLKKLSQPVKILQMSEMQKSETNI